MEKGQEPLQKLAKSDTKWLAEFGGAEELLIIATKCAMCQAGVDSYHFAVSLVKIFHQLTEKTQIVLRDYLKERMNEETFDEDTNEELRRVVK